MERMGANKKTTKKNLKGLIKKISINQKSKQIRPLPVLKKCGRNMLLFLSL